MRRLWGQRQKSVGTFSTTIELGAYGERLALEELKKKGYRVVVTNYTAPLGRSRNGRLITGEIDIIAYDAEGVLCFIEVKTRTSDIYAAPQAAVDLRKQHQIIRTARIYQRMLQLGGESSRFDVVSVLIKAANSEDTQEAAPEVTLLPGYFSDHGFQRSKWWQTY